MPSRLSWQRNIEYVYVTLRCFGVYKDTLHLTSRRFWNEAVRGLAVESLRVRTEIVAGTRRYRKFLFLGKYTTVFLSCLKKGLTTHQATARGAFEPSTTVISITMRALGSSSDHHRGVLVTDDRIMEENTHYLPVAGSIHGGDRNHEVTWDATAAINCIMSGA